MHKKIPTLVKTKTGWTIDSFTPGQSAFRWDEFSRKNAKLYVLQCGDYLKIGVARDLERRRREIDAMNALPVTVIAARTIPLSALLITEAWLHAQFADRRVKGEWFSVSIEEVMAILPDAVRFANAYDRECRDWFQRARVRRINADL